MRIGNVILIAAALSMGVLAGCKKKGCTDPDANNYDMEADKDDDSCTFPTINMNATGMSGDVNGGGGSASNSVTFTQNNATLGWDMSQDASSGSFNLTVRDASGTVVINNTLTVGSGDQDASGTSSSGTTGTWTATVTLTDFTGSGDYSFQ